MIAVFGVGELAKTFSAFIPTNIFLADKEYIPEGGNFLGRTVYELEEIGMFSTKPEIYAPVSYKNCNKDRENVFSRINKLGIKVSSFVHPTAHVNDTSKMGEGCWIGALTNIDPNVCIGRGVTVWGGGSHLGHSSTIGDFSWVTTGACISGQVEIGDRTFVGANAVVFPSVKIGSDCIIGAGAIITKDLPSFSVALEGRNNIISKKSFEVIL